MNIRRTIESILFFGLIAFSIFMCCAKKDVETFNSNDPETEERRECGYVKICEIKLKNKTPCVIAKYASGVSISCDWQEN